MSMRLFLGRAALAGALLSIPACGDEPAVDDERVDDNEEGGDEEEDPDAPTGRMDAGVTGRKDAGSGTTTQPRADAGGGVTEPPKGLDAAVEKPRDSGTSIAKDAAVSPVKDAGGSSSAGTCGGATPHGCYVPKADNPMGCPAQIFEQSAYYPPAAEWKGCNSAFYVPCVYTKPGGGEANCACDLGLHWLCTY